MATLRAYVRNGRIVLDEPTDLPDGTVVDLVDVAHAVLLDDAPLTEEVQQELAEARKGPFISHEEMGRRLAARRSH